MKKSEAQKLSTAIFRMACKYGTETIIITVDSGDPNMGMDGELLWSAEELIERYVTDPEKDQG